METFNTTYGTVTLYSNETYIITPFRENKYWDETKTLALKPYINPNRNILEIGGHCGTSSLIYATFLSPRQQIYVYEPQKKMFALLMRNVYQNNLQHRVVPYNYGVFCYNGAGKMHDKDIDWFHNGEIAKRYGEEAYLPCNFGGVCLGNSGEEVSLITVDDMPHNDIGFIHCDAQGAENFIFSKATELIKRDRPVILFENNVNYLEGRPLYEKVCQSYPEEAAKYKDYNVEHYCMYELGYSQIIRRFFGEYDDLLIP